MTINALGATFDMLDLDDKPALTGMRISRGMLFNLWKQITGHYRWATGECRLRESTLAAEVGLSLPYIGAGLRYLVAREAVEIVQVPNRDGETVLHFSFNEALVQRAEKAKSDWAQAKADRAAGPNLSAKPAKDSHFRTKDSRTRDSEPLDEPINEPIGEGSESAGARATPSPAAPPPPDPAPAATSPAPSWDAPAPPPPSPAPAPSWDASKPAAPPETSQEAAGTAQPHSQAASPPDERINSSKGRQEPLAEAKDWRPAAAGVARAIRFGAVDVEAEIANFQRYHDSHDTPRGSLAFRWRTWCAAIRPEAPAEARRPASNRPAAPPPPRWDAPAGPIIDGTTWEAAPKAADTGGVDDSAEPSTGMVRAESPADEADAEAWERIMTPAEQAALTQRVRGWGKLDWSPGLWAEFAYQLDRHPRGALIAATNQVISKPFLRNITPGDFISRATDALTAHRDRLKEKRREAEWEAKEMAPQTEREAREAQRATGGHADHGPVAASTRERAKAEARAYAGQIMGGRRIEPALAERVAPIVEVLALARPVQASPGWGKGVRNNQACEAVHMAATDPAAALVFLAACEIGNQAGTPPPTPWADANRASDPFAVLDAIVADMRG